MGASTELERALGPSRLARWLTPDRVSWAGVLVGAVSMTCSLLRLSFGHAHDEALIAAVVLGSTVIWSVVAVAAMRSLVREQGPVESGATPMLTSSRGAGRALVVAVIFGWINTATSFLAVELVLADDLGLASCFGAMCAGPTLGAAAGGIYGIAYLWAIWTPERARWIDANDHAETTWLRVGVLLAIGGAIGVRAAPALSTAVLQSVVLVVGVVLVAISVVADLRRWRAIRALLAADRESAIEVHESAQRDANATRIVDVDPADQSSTETHARRWDTVGDGPFRDVRAARVIGLVPDRSALGRYRARRIGIACIALVATLATIPAWITRSANPSPDERSLPSMLDKRRESYRGE